MKLKAKNVSVGRFACDTLILDDGLQICFPKTDKIESMIGMNVELKNENGVYKLEIVQK